MWPSRAPTMTTADLAPLLLLGGPTALELAPRLMASGYRTGQLPWRDEESAEEESAAPAAVILSSTEAERIPALRRRWGALPILLGSAHDSVEGRCLALSSGADDLWLTSAGPSDLLSRLRLHLSLKQAAQKEAIPLMVADLEVDANHHTARRGGHSLALTAREFQLLLLLLRHSPMVVSREQILQEIWPEERTASSNVIEVYVRYLRRKLEAGDRPRLIHTVRGRGYCLRE